ncbi:MAG: hypothetical protein JXR07_01140 [Reichenbachiella sp.]
MPSILLMKFKGIVINEKNLLNNSSEGIIKSLKAFLSKVKNNGNELNINPTDIKVR